MIISYNEFDLGKAYSALSSAIYPVGFLNIRKLLSITVPDDYSNPDPIAEIKIHKALDVSTLVFITAAKNYEFFESNGIKYFVSLGINGTGKHAGRTINTAVFINEPLSINDLVEIVKVITEAKCGALMDYGLRITGTVTDAVAAGTSRLSENVRFAGTATPLGSEVGREVYISVMRLLEKDLNHF
jgi:Uncharacterized conserved protein